MHSYHYRALLVAVFVALAAISSPVPAAAQVDLDLRAGRYADTEEAFIGAGILTGVTGNWYFNPNVEYVFVDPGSLWTLNGDFHYDFAHSGNWSIWAGGGPALLFRDLEDRRGRRVDSETDFGANLLIGAGLNRGAVRPYGQFKVILADETEAVVALGLRF